MNKNYLSHFKAKNPIHSLAKKAVGGGYAIWRGWVLAGVLLLLSLTFTTKSYAVAYTGTLGGAVLSGNACQGAANVLVYSFSLAQTNNSNNIDDFYFTTTAGATATVSSYYVYLAPSAGNSLSAVPANAYLLGSVANAGVGTQTLPNWLGYGDEAYFQITTGNTYYIYITANIIATATVGATVSVSTPTIANFTWYGGAEATGAGSAAPAASTYIVSACPCTSYYSYTGGSATTGGTAGAVQNYTVPSGCTNLNVTLAGARGGDGGYEPDRSIGGNGGMVAATLNVTSGAALKVYVGNVGYSSTYSGANSPGGSNSGGGATGGAGGEVEGGGGGGESDIRGTAGATVAALNSRVVVGGAGGGGSANQNYVAPQTFNGGIGAYNGGAGGGDGNYNGAYVVNRDAYPGTLTAGGAGVYWYGETSVAGALGAGGAGCTTYGSAGGGGGYYGASGSTVGAACGGSSRAITVAAVATVSGATYTDGNNWGAGYVTITPIFTVTGTTPSICAVGVGTVTLSGSVSGATYNLYGGATLITSMTGTGAALTFTVNPTVTTTYTVNATAPSVNMAGSTTITIAAPPTAIAGNNGPVCVGSTLNFTDATTGGIWSTVAGTGTVSVGSTSGIVTGLTTPPLAQGTATVSYSTGSGCTVNTVVTINPVSPISPTPLQVCSGLTTSVSDAIAGTWSSSNTGIATITSGGLITGLAAGTSTIIDLYASGCSASAILTVNISPIAITGPLMLCYNSSGTFLDGTSGGTWSSTSTGIATIVSGTGSATAVSNAVGTTTISYIMPVTGCSAQTILSVNPIPATITGSLNVCTGLTTALSDVTPGGTWSSNNTTDGPVDASGIVTGIIGGTAVISYTLPTTCYATAIVTINTSPAAIAGNFSMCIGIPSLLSDPTGGGGTWSSTNTGVVTIGAGTGIVSPLSSGTTVISYVYSTGCNAATIITVTPSPAAITGTLSSCAELFTPLSDASGGGTWSSSNTTVGTIGLTTGLVYAEATGVTNIEYTYTTTGCYASAVFTVNPSPEAINGTPYVCDGQTATFNDAIPGGTWTSTNTTNATVGISSGIVQGQNPGTATIFYSMGTSCFTTYTVTVTVAPTDITGPPSVCHDYAIALTNGTTPGTWTVTPGSGTATISASGVLTGENPGIVTVSYTTLACNAVTYPVQVNPLPDPITGVGNLCVGSSGTTLADATSGGTWSSSNAGASVSSAGVVSGVDTGAGTNISYTLPTGCYVIAPVIVFPIPDTISGVDSVCPGSSIVLSDPTPGGVWSSSNGTIAKSVAITGEVDGMAGGTVNISYTLISGCYVSVPFVVENPLPASLTVTQSLDTIKCDGVPDTFTAHPVNGGNPTFEWENWGAYIDTGQVYSFLPMHGDYITCVMTTHDICSSPASVQTSIVMNVYPNVAPTVVISTSSSDTSSYLGQVYTFFTNVTYGGTDPGYQWYVNSAAVPGATNSTFTTHVYDYNDSVYCAVTGHSPCDTGIIGNSDTIIIHGIDNLSVGALSATGNDLGLFPNPNTGSFTLSGTVGGTMNKEVQLAVTDMLGRTIYTGTTTPQNGEIRTEIKLDNNVAAGTYLLRVNTESATQTFHFVIGK